MSFCPDKPILTGFLGSFALYQLPALAGRHDGRYMPDTTASQHPVFELHNSSFTTHTSSLINVSHLTEGYCWPTSIKVLGVLYLAEVSSAFWPSKKAC